MKKRIKINTILNIILAVVLINYAYSWMVTEPSYGEIINYNRNLIISSSGIEVEIYIYKDNDYILYENKNIIIDKIAPNDSVRFKFVIKNTKETAAITDIIFANIYGDIEELKPYLSINCANPKNFSITLKDNLASTSTYDGLNITNYIKFYDDFKVEANSTSTIYWTIDLDKAANNTVAEKELTIDNIIFINS